MTFESYFTNEERDNPFPDDFNLDTLKVMVAVPSLGTDFEASWNHMNLADYHPLRHSLRLFKEFVYLLFTPLDSDYRAKMSFGKLCEEFKKQKWGLQIGYRKFISNLKDIMELNKPASPGLEITQSDLYLFITRSLPTSIQEELERPENAQTFDFEAFQRDPDAFHQYIESKESQFNMRSLIENHSTHQHMSGFSLNAIQPDDNEGDEQHDADHINMVRRKWRNRSPKPPDKPYSSGNSPARQGDGKYRRSSNPRGFQRSKGNFRKFRTRYKQGTDGRINQIEDESDESDQSDDDLDLIAGESHAAFNAICHNATVMLNLEDEQTAQLNAIQVKRCYRCGSTEHFIRECPVKPEGVEQARKNAFNSYNRRPPPQANTNNNRSFVHRHPESTGRWAELKAITPADAVEELYNAGYHDHLIAEMINDQPSLDLLFRAE